jgi:hypothetical protein
MALISPFPQRHKLSLSGFALFKDNQANFIFIGSESRWAFISILDITKVIEPFNLVIGSIGRLFLQFPSDILAFCSHRP